MRKEQNSTDKSEKTDKGSTSSVPPVPLPPGFDSIGPEDSSVDLVPTLKQQSGVTVSLPSTVDIPKIPGYEVVRILGRGGMGTVFLAKEEALQRKVALKLVAQGVAGSQALRTRFDAEVKTLATLQHPNIAQLFSAGQHNQTPYFVMEYVDGPTLNEHAKTPMDAKAAARFMVLVCDAIEYCHQQGVLHRDLKPSNILLTQDLQPKIADFGLAKAIDSDNSSTRTGEILGTPGYMSPEQASGVVKNLDGRCDVYGLGAILFRLLTGRAPFVAAEPFQTVMMVLSDDPIRPKKLVPNIPTDLEIICLKCLEKKPADRYASADALKDDLVCFLEEKPIKARATSPFRKCVKWIKRNPTPTVALTSVVIAIAAAIAGLAVHNNRLTSELERSKRLANRGSEFAKWITSEHLKSLNEISGTTQSRGELVEKVRQFLNDSYDDMPADSKYTFRLGDTYAQLAANYGGNRQNTLGMLDEAEKSFLTAIQLYDQAIEDGEDHQAVLYLKIDALLELSQIYNKLSRADDRDRVLQEAQQYAEELDPEQPETIYINVQILNQRIDREMEGNQAENALKLLDELESLISQLASSDFDSGSREGEILNQKILLASSRGLCEENLGRLTEAEKQFRISTQLASDSYEADPKNVLKARRATTTIIQLADCLFAQEMGEDALEMSQKALKISRALAKQDQNSVEAQLDLATKLSRVADEQQYLGDLANGEKAISEAIEIHYRLKEQGKQNINIDHGLMIYLQSKAIIHQLQGKVDRAKSLFKEHRKICDETLDQDPQSVFALNQVAESELSQALMLLSNWLQEEFDPTKVRESSTYLEIKQHLKNSADTYNRMQEMGPLNYHQQEQQQRVQQTDEVVEQVVEQIEDAARQNDGS